MASVGLMNLKVEDQAGLMTVSLFPATSDTAILAGAAIAEQTNAKGWYTFTVPTTETGWHRMELTLVATGKCVGGGWINLTNSSPTWDRVHGDDHAVDMTRISGSTQAADALRQAALATASGTVQTDAGNTSLTFDTNLPVQADSFYGDSNGGTVIAFVSGSNNAYQTRRIVASTTVGGNTVVTLESALDDVPTDGDAFVVLGRITELA